MDEKFKEEYKRVQNNAVYFLEMYYNKVSENNIELSDKEKQELFDKHKGVPLFDDFSKCISFNEKIKELKNKGYKDWEIH
ncbi:hypothetical protein [Chryseobacterium sp.]|uniref:hypothetical protein n=1 Tax=Chryseobacterium sp. TaxID=1871047 RepID=UPI0035B3740F